MNSHSFSESRRRGLRARFREESTREILAAAEAVFAEAGLHGAGMSQIAERAGVAVGTLYNRFRDREALVQAVLEQRRMELLENLDGKLEELARAPFIEQLRGFLLELFLHFEAHHRFFELAFAAENDHAAKREMSTALYERVEVLVKRGHREKALRRDVERSFGILLLSTARTMLMREHFGLRRLAPENAVEAVVTFFMNGAGR